MVLSGNFFMQLGLEDNFDVSAKKEVFDEAGFLLFIRCEEEKPMNKSNVLYFVIMGHSPRTKSGKVK